jgi:anti-sigma-K factor RskA
MRHLSPQAAHALAAEYVIGTLRGRARQRFEAIARADRAVAAILAEWEGALTPLALRIAPEEPPARVWKAIEARIAGSDTATRALRTTLGFWRSFGLLAGGVASVLLAAFLFLSGGPRGDPLFVAVLADSTPAGAPRMVVSLQAPDQLRVRMVKPWKAAPGKDLELWVLPKEGAPRSLGLIVNAMGDTLIRIDPADARVRDATALAVSLEPQGGSPTKLPTGPVLCSGPIAPVRKA